MAAHHMNKIAPVHMHSPSSSSTSMQQFTVGKLDAGMAILLGSRASLIEFPSLLLPQDVTAGSVVEISVKRNVEQERRNRHDFDALQRDILDTFGRLGPAAPEVRLRAVTQTSVVLEWSPLQLATSTLLSLDIYRNGARLAPIPNPVSNTSTKLSGLEVGAEYAFHLVLKTTAGTLTSNTIRTKTHTMTDTSGIAICFGAVDGGGPVDQAGADAPAPADSAAAPSPEPMSQLEALARDLLREMGAKWSTRLQIDTTHYVCTSPRARPALPQSNGGPALNAGAEGPTYRKALGLNIPVVRPEWVVACYEAKRMVPIAPYYIDQDPPNHASVQKLLGDRAAKAQAAGAGAPGATAGDGAGAAAAAGVAGAAGAAGAGAAAAAALAAGKEQPPLPPPSPEPEAQPVSGLDEEPNKDAGAGAGAGTSASAGAGADATSSTSTETTPKAGAGHGAAGPGAAEGEGQDPTPAAATEEPTATATEDSHEHATTTAAAPEAEAPTEHQGEARAQAQAQEQDLLGLGLGGAGGGAGTGESMESISLSLGSSEPSPGVAGTRHGTEEEGQKKDEEEEEAADEEVDLS